jgi:SM-20-related protein
VTVGQDATIAAALAANGYAVVADFLAAAEAGHLAGELRRRDARGDFRPAATGAGSQRAVRPAIRGDRIHWVIRPEAEAEVALLARLEALKVALNANCLLGLVDLECHYAIYPPGAGYVRHLDRSPAGVERVVSIVLYLNERWVADDGGQLRLYVEPPVDVNPAGGTLVLFLSDTLEHQVLPTRRERLSLTGWFRRRSPLLGGAPV